MSIDKGNLERETQTGTSTGTQEAGTGTGTGTLTLRHRDTGTRKARIGCSEGPLIDVPVETVAERRQRLSETYIATGKVGADADIEGYFRTIGKHVQCLECHKAMRRSEMREHHNAHMEEKPFECNVCLKRFTRSDKLVTHSKIHSGVRPYPCFCRKRFIRLDHLKTHLATHNLPISDCQMLLDQALKEESNKASGDDTGGPNSPGGTGDSPVPYTRVVLPRGEFLDCPYCTRKFAQSYKYNRHLRLHTGEKPYKCSCGAKYARSERLHRHLLAYPDHTGEKDDTKQATVGETRDIAASKDMAGTKQPTVGDGGTKQLTVGPTGSCTISKVGGVGTKQATVGAGVASGTKHATVGGSVPGKSSASNTVGTKQATVGTSHTTVGSSGISTGTSHTTVGSSGISTGTNPATVGSSGISAGTSHTTVGTNNTTVGSGVGIVDLTGTKPATVGSAINTGTNNATVDTGTSGLRPSYTVGTIISPGAYGDLRGGPLGTIRVPMTDNMQTSYYMAQGYNVGNLGGQGLAAGVYGPPGNLYGVQGAALGALGTHGAPLSTHGDNVPTLSEIQEFSAHFLDPQEQGGQILLQGGQIGTPVATMGTSRGQGGQLGTHGPPVSTPGDMGQIGSSRGQMEASRGQIDSSRGQMDGSRGQMDGSRGQIDASRGQMGSPGAQITHSTPVSTHGGEMGTQSYHEAQEESGGGLEAPPIEQLKWRLPTDTQVTMKKKAGDSLGMDEFPMEVIEAEVEVKREYDDDKLEQT